MDLGNAGNHKMMVAVVPLVLACRHACNVRP
jgi:hypothetical protein